MSENQSNREIQIHIRHSNKAQTTQDHNPKIDKRSVDFPVKMWNS